MFRPTGWDRKSAGSVLKRSWRPPLRGVFMPKSIWNRVVESKPIDQKAKSIARSGGIHYEPPPPSDGHRWFADCPAKVPIPACILKQPDFSDLTGTVIGDMRVIGWGGPGNGWICRCVCGRFEYKSRKGVLRPDPSSSAACCIVCNNTRGMRDFRKPSVFNPPSQKSGTRG